MSLFNLKKKSVVNEALLDLRNYTPEALNRIKMINAATVILPQNPPVGFIEAYSGISFKNVANVITADENMKLNCISGVGELGFADYDTLYSISGIVVIKSLGNERPLNVVASGIVIYDELTNVNFIAKSGVSVKLDFKLDKTKFYSKDAELDKCYIEQLENAVVVAGKDLYLSDDVDEACLLEKNIHLFAGKNLICNKAIKSAAQLKSTVGSKYIFNE